MTVSQGGDSKDDNPTESLRTRILHIASGSHKLASEPDLAALLGVSRPALREELTKLEAQGLLRKLRGDGTYVNRRALNLEARFDQHRQFSRVLEAAGFDASLEVLVSHWDHPSPEEVDYLEVDHGSMGLRQVKRWRANGTVVMVSHVFLVRKHVARYEPEPRHLSLVDQVKRLSRETVEWESGAVRARTFTTDDDALFASDGGEIALELDLVGYSKKGRPLYRNVETHLSGAVPFSLVRTVN